MAAAETRPQSDLLNYKEDRSDSASSSSSSREEEEEQDCAEQNGMHLQPTARSQTRIGFYPCSGRQTRVIRLRTSFSSTC